MKASADAYVRRTESRESPDDYRLNLLTYGPRPDKLVIAAREAHSAFWYRLRRADEATMRGRLKELAAERRRFGYRRLKVLLDRGGDADEPQETTSRVCRGGCRFAAGADASARWAHGHR